MTCSRLVLAAFLVVSCVTAAPTAPPRPGRDCKIRILVDKVMLPVEKWVTREWIVKETADAGFNVFSPRLGNDRYDEVRQVAEWCRKHGIYHMPWMRGTLNAPETAESEGRRVVWFDGTEQPLWSVNSDEFWEWTTERILVYAKLSAENPHLMGVFLDYENYAPRKRGNLYWLSYDDKILAEFAKEKGIGLPTVPFRERVGMLAEKGLSDAFETFQVGSWRARCRALRKAVDAIAPDFQFCIYPAPGTPFMVQACYPEWSTKRAPIILGDAGTYGRPSRFLTHAESLKANKASVEKRMLVPRDAGIPHVYASGLDPVCTGADPEFCGKNALMISAVSDGYWVFYEGPKYNTTHKDYMKWFSWANRAIEEKRLSDWQLKRETPETGFAGLLSQSPEDGLLLLPEATGKTVVFPEMQFRGRNQFVVSAQAGKPLTVGLRHRPLSRYKDTLKWQLRSVMNSMLAEGEIGYDKSASVLYTPQKTGLLLLSLGAGRCAYSVTESNAALGVLMDQRGVSFLFGCEALRVHVPDTGGKFSATVRTMGSETAKLTFHDAAGAERGTLQTSLAEARATRSFPFTKKDEGIWSLGISEADEGTLEDVRVYLRGNVCPILSLAPEHVFRLRAK